VNREEEEEEEEEEGKKGAHLAEGSWLLSLVWLRMVEELVALEGVAVAHVTRVAAIVVGAGVAND